jgi:hypothetical protein
MVAPQPTLNPERHCRADGGPPIEYLGQSGPVDAQLRCCFTDLEIQGRQNVIPQR